MLCLAGCRPAAEVDWGLALEPTAVWREGRLLIRSEVRLEFSPAALEALENGVALTLVVHTRASRRMGPIARLSDEHHWRAEIQYLPLSRHWQLRELETGRTENFPRRWMLVDSLAQPRVFATGLQRQDLAGGRWQVQIRAFIDRSALPAPMHLPSWLSAEWRLSSRWHTWQVDAA